METGCVEMETNRRMNFVQAGICLICGMGYSTLSLIMNIHVAFSLPWSLHLKLILLLPERIFMSTSWNYISYEVNSPKCQESVSCITITAHMEWESYVLKIFINYCWNLMKSLTGVLKQRISCSFSIVAIVVPFEFVALSQAQCMHFQTI